MTSDTPVHPARAASRVLPERVDELETLIRLRTAATPDLVAIEEEDGSTTYAELGELSDRLASALVAAGIEPGDRVAIVGENSAAFIVTLFGAAKAGAVLTPVNVRLSPQEIGYILRDSEPEVVVLGRGFETLAETAHDAGVPLVVTVEPCPGTSTFDSWLADVDPADPGRTRDREDTALILYSSGTTGRPKGVELVGRALGQALLALRDKIDLAEGSVALAPVPYFHVAGLGLALAAVARGATLLVKPFDSPARLLEIIESRRVTHLVAVPTLIQFMLAQPQARDGDWSALQLVIYGASPIPEPVLREATEVFGCQFIQSYGLTESTGGVTLLGPEDHRPAPGALHRLASVGRPHEGAQIMIVDPETCRELPVGARGEVWVKGDYVMKGYWRNPQATSEALVDGWLRTGDGGSLDHDGYLYLHDRLKDLIVSGGENIYPAEVESAMTGHPGIAQVAVIGVPSPTWGECPIAVVVRASGDPFSEDEILAWTRERLAHFKVPRGVAFVEALPLTASGKVNKVTLREQLAGWGRENDR